MVGLRTACAVIAVLSLFGCASAPTSDPSAPQLAPEAKVVPPRIGLVLGGGAARGFAHVGVIKALEANGIVPDIIVGTSVGSLVGALYASGYRPADLQRVALQMDESIVSDWSLPDRGFFKGEGLESFVNRAVQNRPLEKLNRTFAVVVTDLQSGEKVVLGRGNTGAAVRASSSIPGVFRPVRINGREYVDGGLTSPVPVRVARSLGAEFVIAVDVSGRPRDGKTGDTLDMLLQTFNIMGQALAANELPEADVVIRPETSRISAVSFEDRRLAIQEGERATLAQLPVLRDRMAKKAIRADR
jgi:NTE family protein